MFIPKTKKIKNKKYLIYVASKQCALELLSHDWCQGAVQAHHLLKPYDGKRGMGMKAGDNNCIPLCQFHHAKLHDSKGNEDEYWRMFGLDTDFGRVQARMLWESWDGKKS